ncbi:hypothetical protein ACT6QG_10625 [Xanthobacter sp. TB0136]|uniref:hypothetical protein n=1 Tax=Xanthobacter sp. TB0136 TaxID=3459177 RepID=UPI0040395B9C
MEQVMDDRAGMKRLSGFGLTSMVFGLVALALCATAPRAEAANFFQKNFWLSGPDYSANIPQCNDTSALQMIADRFAQTERRFWSSSLAITEFGPVKEIAFRPWGENYVPRRYCTGTIQTNDARKRTIYYSIVEDGGFAGFSWGVQWCIVGLDRNYAYAPSCKMARP